jgi:coatomer subunit zeta
LRKDFGKRRKNLRMVCILLFIIVPVNHTFARIKGDVIIYDGHLVLYRQTLDLIFYIVSTPNENELMLSAGFTAFYDALSLLFRNQVEKRVLLDNLDVLLLALDETFDDG